MTIAKLNDLGQEIFMSRYAYPGEKEWRQRAKAIARTVAGAEPDEDKERDYVAKLLQLTAHYKHVVEHKTTCLCGGKLEVDSFE